MRDIKSWWAVLILKMFFNHYLNQRVFVGIFHSMIWLSHDIKVCIFKRNKFGPFRPHKFGFENFQAWIQKTKVASLNRAVSLLMCGLTTLKDNARKKNFNCLCTDTCFTFILVIILFMIRYRRLGKINAGI